MVPLVATRARRNSELREIEECEAARVNSKAADWALFGTVQALSRNWKSLGRNTGAVGVSGFLHERYHRHSATKALPQHSSGSSSLSH